MKTFVTAESSIPPVLFTPADAERFLHDIFAGFDALTAAGDRIVAAEPDPLVVEGRAYVIPRYVYLGAPPDATPLRLALYAGWTRGDLRPSFALLETLRSFAARPDAAHGYQLVLYPLVNPAAFDPASGPAVAARDLRAEAWDTAGAPEVRQLARDYQAWQLDGWISLTSIEAIDQIHAVAVGLPVDPAFFPVEQGRFQIRWLTADASRRGPHDLGADLTARPIGLELAVPAHWPDALFAAAVSTTIRAFLPRYLAARAHAQHL